MLKSFTYIADENAKLLILGSMPGQKSLDESEYYAHPKNMFWDIIGLILGFKREDTSYEDRLAILTKNRIALWDVVARCRREGSLDSNIETDSVVLNDFKSFLKKYKNIEYIIFNGKKAESLFQKNYSSIKKQSFNKFKFITMSSTSPANASIKREEKIEKWLMIKEILGM